MKRLSDPERLEPSHAVASFSCGEASLNLWLERHARAAQGAGSARVFVVTDSKRDGHVVGYHALAVASIESRDATDRAKKGMPRRPIPALLLARLAVDESVQRNGLGAFLLRDAMLRTVSAADEVSIRILLAHALNDEARAFYVKFGFEASPTDKFTLQMLVKDIRAAIS